ncbi:hypothetical protein [Legionella sainthelensi]|uniref:hypothetical protein n=1 Tax=Legionella sainthelensi TaxID=28087 RepID=UPI000485C867|nr:hypothetical protein [Legionella sainthelensi]
MIWDDANLQFDNFTYGYKVQHTHIAAKTKVLFDQGYRIGEGFNDAYSYQSTPLIFKARPTPHFKLYTQTTFTYYTVDGGCKSL